MNPVDAFFKGLIMPYVWLAIIIIGFVAFVHLPYWLMVAIVSVMACLSIIGLVNKAIDKAIDVKH
jgi:diacylglycerol kinase